MDRLSSHLLLSIFKWLDSLEVVKIRPVCPKWLEIIEENRSLWRRPVLPHRKNGWQPSTLELFDRKSQSTLEDVSIHLDTGLWRQKELLPELLERSKDSLRFLFIYVEDFPSISPLYDLSLKLPRLVEFRVSRLIYESWSKVLLKRNETEDNDGPHPEQNLSNLKILQCYDCPRLIELHLNLLDNLSSLSLFIPLSFSEWRRILEVPSRKLTHSRMGISFGANIFQYPPLSLPKLKLLQVRTELSILPQWLRIPSTSTFISEDSTTPISLPSISILCLTNLIEIQRLRKHCPLLEELEVGMRFQYIKATFSRKSVEELVSLLEERKEQSETGFEVDGVKMGSLKRLVIPYEQLKSEELEKLRNLVEEVVDVKSISPFMEIEV